MKSLSAEARRLAALQSYGLLGTCAELAYDQITALDAKLFGVPICLASLVGENEQWMPDLIERAGERLLRPVGRCDGAVKMAGFNVWLIYVAQVLRDADGVADVAGRLHANGRLTAFIVPGAGRETNDLASQLDRYIAQKLNDHERPKSFRFGAVLPRNVMGKLEDWA